MDRSSRVAQILKSGGFSIHYYIGRFSTENFFAQCCILAAISTIAIVTAAGLDGAFFLAGRNVGLFEHPAIWAFIALQITLPLSLRRSLRKVSGCANVGQGLAPNPELSTAIVDRLVPCVRLRERNCKVLGALFYVVGLAAFVWNSYQNQLPGVIVLYDFWDSVNHPWSYWVTRVYKFYLFVWLLPYVALVHAAVLVVSLRIIRERRMTGSVDLQPFHPDGVGGLGWVPALVTTPIIATLLIASIPVAAAFEVHRAFDVTPMIGAAVVILGALIAYVVPVLHLRSDILALKLVAVENLRSLQQSYYSTIIEKKEIDIESLRQGNEALDYFEKISKRINEISNYPHFTHLLKYVGLALTPSVASLALKLYEDLGPALIPLLRAS